MHTGIKWRRSRNWDKLGVQIIKVLYSTGQFLVISKRTGINGMPKQKYKIKKMLRCTYR